MRSSQNSRPFSISLHAGLWRYLHDRIDVSPRSHDEQRGPSVGGLVTIRTPAQDRGGFHPFPGSPALSSPTLSSFEGLGAANGVSTRKSLIFGVSPPANCRGKAVDRRLPAQAPEQDFTETNAGHSINMIGGYDPFWDDVYVRSGLCTGTPSV